MGRLWLLAMRQRVCSAPGLIAGEPVVSARTQKGGMVLPKTT